MKINAIQCISILGEKVNPSVFSRRVRCLYVIDWIFWILWPRQHLDQMAYDIPIEKSAVYGYEQGGSENTTSGGDIIYVWMVPYTH